MPVKEKDHGKCKEWEKRRRDKLNDAFVNLAQLLPNHDPAKIPAKIDILQNSTEFVKELRLSNSRLLSRQAENDEKCKLIKELQDEVNRLILRVKQLTILLQKADITIPTGPEIKSLGRKRPKWSGRLQQENVENSVIPSTDLSANSSPSKDARNLGEENVAEPLGAAATSAVSKPVSEAGANTIVVSTASSSTTNSTTNSIIIPLRETKTNSIKPGDSASSLAQSLPTVTLSTAPSEPSISQVAFSSQPTSTQKSTTLFTLASPSTSTAQIISTEPVFTTATATPIQLPLQTFILAPCPITGTTTALPTVGALPHSQILTRIALPTALLPKSLDAISFPKIPIKPVLKPQKRVIKRRRKRTPKVKPDKPDQTTHNKDLSAKNSTTSPASTDQVPDIETVLSSSSGVIASDKTAVSVPDDTPSPPPDKNLAEEKGPDDVASVEQSEPKTASSSEELCISTSTPELSESLEDKSVQASTENTPPSATTTDRIEKQVDVVPESSKEILPSDSRLLGVESNDVTESSADNIPVLRIIEAGPSAEEITTIKEGDLLSQVNVIVEEPQKKGETSIEEGTVGTAACNEILAPNGTATEASTSSHVETIQTSNLSLPQASSNDAPICGEASSVAPSTINVSMDTSDGVPQSLSQSDQSKPKPPHKTTQETCLIENDKVTSIVDTTKDTTEKNNSASANAASKELQDDSMEVASTKTANVEETNRTLKPIEQEIDLTPLPSQTPTLPSDTRETILPFMEPLRLLPAMVPTSTTSVLSTPTKSKDDESQSGARGSSSSSASATKRIPSLHHDLLDTNDSITTTDKISECIARSIDLIDANDSELMELGEHWEDTGGSPKSPISPTQMFLSMFPLLPRESSVVDQQHPQPQPTSSLPQLQHSIVPLSQSVVVTSASSQKSSTAPFATSSTNRSSFFIDAMLPDDHSTSNTTSLVEEMASSNITPCLALTPPQFSSTAQQQISSPFSLSSNYYWTPCSVDNSFPEYRSTSTFPQRTISGSCSSTNGVASASSFTHASTTAAPKPFSTFSPIKATPPSTSTFISTSSTSHATTLSLTTTSSSLSTPTKNASTGKTGKGSKSASASKQSSTSDTKISKSSTVAASVTTATTVTWTVSAPTQSVSSHTHHASTSSSSATNQITQMSTTAGSTSQVYFPHHSSSTSATPSSTCPLLESLTPMDASFLRPLFNALDGHDFRSLDFASGNSLPPPPPPPLPTLIPPVPTKPLYTSQFNSGSSSSQHSFNVNYHTPTATSHEHIPTLQSSAALIHHHPAPLFGGKTQQQPQQSVGSSHSRATTCSKKQAASSALSSLSSTFNPLETATKSSGSTTNSEKTSRTSGRQKAESSRQSRSGKSSRTQPYFISNSSQNKGQEQQPFEASVVSNQQPGTSRAQCDSFPIGHHTQGTAVSSISHKPTSTAASTVHSKNYGFEVQNSSVSTFHTMPPAQYPFLPTSTANQEHHEQLQGNRQHARNSSSETKAQKSREDKSKGNAQSNVDISKSSRSTCQSHASSSTALAMPTTTSHNSISLVQQQPVRTLAVAPAFPKPVSQGSTTKSNQAPNPSEQIANAAMNPHASFQFYPEPFQLFPEYGGGNTSSRQFAGHQSSYNQDMIYSEHSQQQDISSNAYTPYRANQQSSYLPDISYDSFAVPFQPQQPQTQHPQPSLQQQSHSNVVSATPGQSNVSGQSTNSNLPTNYNANVNVLKYNYNNPIGQTSVPASVASVSSRNIHQFSQSHSSSLQSHGQDHHPSQGTLGYSQQERAHLPQQQGASTSQTHPNTNQSHRPPEASRQQTQHRSQSSSSISTPTTSSLSVATSAQIPKPKQNAPQTVLPPQQSFNLQQAKQSSQNSNQTGLHLHQHPKQQQSQSQQRGQIQQQVPVPSQQQTNRSPSRPVNWMTDTTYRTSSSNTGVTKQRQTHGAVGSANNPFSVSKLVGNSSSVQGKAQQGNLVELQQQQTHVPRTSNTSRGKLAQNPSDFPTVNPNSSSSHSQNQSNYCAEALIRKNPAPNNPNDWNEFGFGGNPAYQCHSAHHSYHTPHGGHQQAAGPDHFPSYGQYHHYPSGAQSASVTSHFTRFDHSQHDQFHPTQHQSNNSQQGNYHRSSSARQQQTSHPQHPHHSHNIQQPHQQQHGQLQYLGQGHNQSHTSSTTSSVSNFNLSTIFPEINDRSNNGGVGGSRNNVSENNGSTGPRSGGAGSTCSYQHPGFGNQTGSGRNLQN